MTHDAPQVNFASVDIDHWHAGGPAIAHFYNALSLFFPKGERFLIYCLRSFADRVDGTTLKDEIRQFCEQEAAHSREHVRYNARIKSRHPQVVACDFRMFSASLTGSPCLRQLAMSVAMEHFTASLAKMFFDDEDLIGDNELRAVWQWHAGEEISHQAVAFEVMQSVVPSAWRRYRLRTLAMLQVCGGFWWRMAKVYAVLLRSSQGRLRLRDLWALARHLWGPRGLLLRMLPDFFDFFRPGYFPGQGDEQRPGAASYPTSLRAAAGGS